MAWSFYIILSGQLEVFIIRDSQRQKVFLLTQINLLNPGDCLGRIHLLGDVRQACVSSSIPTEVILVNKREYI